jgi:opacity protein-like surface antigen
MKRIFTICVLSCVASLTSAYATPYPASGKTYIGGGIGELFPKVNTTQTIPTGAGWPNDTYTNNSNPSNEGFLYVNGGRTWKRQSNWLPYYSVGVRYTYSSNMTVKGTVDQYSLPQFNNYTYKYSIQQENLLAIIKADIVRWKRLMPYLTIGGGLSSNNTFNYREQAVSGVTPRVSPGFSSYTSNNFAYILGGGFDFILKKNLWMNLEYNYNHFGTVKTGNGANTPTLTGFNFSNTSLKNKLTANTVMLGVNYYLG